MQGVFTDSQESAEANSTSGDIRLVINSSAREGMGTASLKIAAGKKCIYFCLTLSINLVPKRRLND